MKTEVTITIKPEQEKDKKLILRLAVIELKKKKIPVNSEIHNDQLVFLKKSIDARHGQIKFHLKYAVYIGEKPESTQSSLPVWKKTDGKKSVIIVGSGPAGLFGALKLLEYGIKPIIIERGTDTVQRRKDIQGVAKIGIDDFAKVDLRVAQIVDCVPVKRAKKLLQLTLDDGTKNPRTVASGIAKWYKPEDLIGKKVIVVSNLKPAVLCGVESCGMILAADCSEDDVKVVFVENMPNGAKIR